MYDALFLIILAASIVEAGSLMIGRCGLLEGY
jgi:hypothetical protein